MLKLGLGFLCWLVLGTADAENSTEQSVLWILRPELQEQEELLWNLTFPARGFYSDCLGNCSCENLLRRNVEDLLNWAEFVKKVDVGTASRGRFLRSGFRDPAGLWQTIDFFIKKFFKLDFAGDPQEDIFSRMIQEFQGRGRRFLMIAVEPDFDEINKLLKVKDNNKTTVVITGACSRKVPYLATENQKLFESIKTVYEIPLVVKSILDNCYGLCNSTIPRVKKRVIRSNDDEIIQYEKLDEDPEPQAEEELEEEERDPRNSSSSLTKSLIIIIEFALTVTLAFI